MLNLLFFLQRLLTWTSLPTLGGSLLVELILLVVIYDTQMFRISSYPVGGVCAHTRARVCGCMRERMRVAIIQSFSRLLTQGVPEFSNEFLIRLPKNRRWNAVINMCNRKT